MLFYPGSDRWTPARGDTTGRRGSLKKSHQKQTKRKTQKRIHSSCSWFLSSTQLTFIGPFSLSFNFSGSWFLSWIHFILLGRFNFSSNFSGSRFLSWIPPWKLVELPVWHFCRQVKTLKILIVGFFKALDLIKISFDLLSPGPPPYPILWPTLAQYGLTIVRVVIGQFGWHIDFTLSCRG